jgi:hypothetical protein
MATLVYIFDMRIVGDMAHCVRHAKVAVLSESFYSVVFFEKMTRRLKSASAVSSVEFPPNFIQNLLPSRTKL